MKDPRKLIRVLWCEIATMALVLTGDIPFWVSVLVLTLIPIFGLADPSSPWLAAARRASAGMAVLYLLFFPLDWLVLSGRLIFATVHLTFYLKLHTLLHQESARERSRLHLICLFEMLAAASMTVEASFVSALTLFVFVGTLALTLEHTRPAELDSRMLRTAARSSLIVAMPLLLLAGIAFIMLPRPMYGGFRLGGLTGITMTGFTERVRLGDFEEIRRDNDIVMRIVSDGIDVSPPRWRGPAYDRYEGGEWRQTLSGVSSLPGGPGNFLLDRTSSGPRARHEVFLEPLDTDVLFLPPASSSITTTERYVFIDPYLTLRTGRSARAGRHYAVSWRYRAAAETSPVGGVERMSEARHRLYTQLPELSRRFHDLAERVASGDVGIRAARRVEQYLRSSFGYTLQSPARMHADPLEDFLFGSEAGHCEYFATAMVMMLRSQAIPSRLVTGFNRGQRNALAEFEVVRKTNAHAWVEAFDERRGWVAFDPTPAAIDIEQLQRTSILSQGIDSLRMLWDLYVVAFDVERQRGVLGRASELGDTALVAVSRGMQAVRRHSMVAIAVVLAVLALLALMRTRWSLRLRIPFWRLGETLSRQHASVRFYAKLFELLERLGIEKPLGQTPFEFAKEWESSLPGITELTLLYYRVRFGGEVLSPRDQTQAERLSASIRLAAISDARGLA